ncbi:helix-turn-helix domain-containing protein [Paenibacillus thailandensis]|uniref:Helix-turn-helix domain-containing protein n=1 Tax=Paenibacillus thailandensis TaxID=393250 RepID=A0ABW5R231_9BACL
MTRDIKKGYSLIDSVLSSREAAEVWGLSENTVTQWCNRGKFQPDEARKSGKVWLVTREGMIRITGREPGERGRV